MERIYNFFGDTKKLHITLFIVIFLLFIQAITSQLNGNILLLLGGIFQTDFSGEFPGEIYTAYGRGIGHKSLLYFLYKTNNLFFGEWQYEKSEVFIQAIYYLFSLGLCYLSLRFVRKELKEHGFNYVTMFLLFALIMLIATHRQTLEASETAVFMVVIMFCLALSKKTWANWLAGVFVLFLFSLKGITILYAGFPFIFLWFIYQKGDKRLFRFVGTCAAFTVITGLVYFLLLPLEIEYFQEQSIYQSGFRFKLTTLPLYVVKGATGISCIPQIAMAVIMFIWALLKFKNKKLFRFTILLLIIPSMYVIIQHKWLPYQYISFFPAIFLLMMFAKEYTDKKQMIRLTLVSTSITLIIFGVTNLLPLYKVSPAAIDPYCNRCNYELTYYKSDKDIFFDLKERYPLEEQVEILHLTPGMSAYFIHAKSYLHMLNPLPLQRIQIKPEIKETLVYANMLKRVMAYQGDYVIMDSDWMDISLVPQLDKKLSAQYEIVESHRSFEEKNIVLFQRR